MAIVEPLREDVVVDTQLFAVLRLCVTGAVRLVIDYLDSFRYDVNEIDDTGDRNTLFVHSERETCFLLDQQFAIERIDETSDVGEVFFLTRAHRRP
nr:hypothetical protein [Halorientalis pallida]